MEITNKDIDNGKGFDWGRTSEGYSKYRDIYPEDFYKKLLDMNLCVNGQRVLDIGTGTGVLPRNLYKYGAEFTGVDISENQIEQARRLSQEKDMNISYIVSPVETMEFPDKYFDVVTACQCYTYFDKSKLFSKIHTVLKDSGYFCILHMVWLFEESEIAAQTEKLVLKYNPSWSGHSVKREDFTFKLPKEAEGLFEVSESFTYDTNVTFTRESWHGRIKTCRGIGAQTSSLTEQEITNWEKEHIHYLSQKPEVFDIPHFVSVFNLHKI